MSKHEITYEVARLNIGRVVRLKDRSGDCFGTLETASRNVMEIRIGKERVVRKRYGEVWDAPNKGGNHGTELVLPVERVDVTGPVRVHEETAMERAKRLEEQERDGAKVKAAKQLLAETGQPVSLDLLMDRYKAKLAAVKAARDQLLEANQMLELASEDVKKKTAAIQACMREAEQAREALQDAVTAQTVDATQFLNEAMTARQ